MLDRPRGPMAGTLYLDRSQDTYQTCRTKDPLFGQQRSTMAAKVRLSEDMLDECDHGLGIVR